MNESSNQSSKRPAFRNLAYGLVMAIATLVVACQFFRPHEVPAVSTPFQPTDDFQEALAGLNHTFKTNWTHHALSPSAPADNYTIARRISLALTGTVPSYQELKALDMQPEENQVQWWLSHVLEDRRSADYLAERFTRVFVGTEAGPFLQYRRRRLTEWISDQFHENTSYDQLCRSLIQSDGIWTSKPEVNFITVSIDQNNDKKGPDEVKLASRLTRAFLGVRIDCVQCHDDKMGDRWKQEDFHQLASFFANAEVSITGIRDNEKVNYEYRYKGKSEEAPVPQVVPFQSKLLPEEGGPRERLASWVTHPENKAFARTTVNRIWAMLFNQPLISPIDDIPLEGPYPVGMDILTDDLIQHGYDLQRLIRLIVSSRPFQLDSRSADPDQVITQQHEETYATFPLTRLRPDQVAGAVIQSSSLSTIDAGSHVISRITRFTQTSEFLKRYGDMGEDEFGESSGTIPQRLLLMNGELVDKRTGNNMVGNAATRIGALAINDEEAVRVAYLTLLTRLPSMEELQHFAPTLEGLKGDERGQAMQDICWALINATEFSWNH